MTCDLQDGFYAVEVALLSLTLLLCSTGLLCSVLVHQVISSQPSKLAVVTLVMANAWVYTCLGMLWIVGVLSLVASLPFVIARYSQVAFCATATAAALVLPLMLRIVWGMSWWQVRFYQAQARAIVEADRSRDSAKAPAQPVASR